MAASFTPGRLSRAYGQRDRIAALLLLAAMAASVPLAVQLHSDLEKVQSHALLPFLLFLAPTAVVALASAGTRAAPRSPLGVRLAKLLAVMVVVTAIVTAPPLPPASACSPATTRPWREESTCAAAADASRPCVRPITPARSASTTPLGALAADGVLPVGRDGLGAAPPAQAASDGLTGRCRPYVTCTSATARLTPLPEGWRGVRSLGWPPS